MLLFLNCGRGLLHTTNLISRIINGYINPNGNACRCARCIAIRFVRYGRLFHVSGRRFLATQALAYFPSSPNLLQRSLHRVLQAHQAHLAQHQALTIEMKDSLEVESRVLNVNERQISRP